MLLLAEKLTHVPVMSLQTGGELARTGQPIIDPRSLTIPAIYVTGGQVEATPALLHTDDIRESGSMGFIIDDSSKIMGLDGLVRLQEIIDFHFDIMACTVYERSGTKLGKVTDFSYDALTFRIQQLFIKQPLLRSLGTMSSIIHRKQIISVTNERIVVDTPTVPIVADEQTDAQPVFVNPFRAHAAQPEQVETDG